MAFMIYGDKITVLSKIKEGNDVKVCNFSKCRQGLHPFRVISRTTIGIDEEKVVRWCPECGAIVVDLDYDGRTMPGYYKKLQYPNITKKYGLE